jgi:hypothetical protein
MMPLPDHESNQTDGRDDDKVGDKPGAEPIVFLSFVEHHLKRSYAQSKQRDANIVDAHAGPGHPPQVGRIFHQVYDQPCIQGSDGKIDEEDPTPAIVVSDLPGPMVGVSNEITAVIHGGDVHWPLSRFRLPLGSANDSLGVSETDHDGSLPIHSACVVAAAVPHIVLPTGVQQS